MKECAKVQRLLSRYIDKEAAPAETVLVEAHLGACPLCKNEFAELSRNRELIVERQRKVVPPDFLISRLRADITRERLEAGHGVSWLEGIGILSRRLIPVPVAAIALLVLFLIVCGNGQKNSVSLEEHILSGTQTTTETALGLILDY
jgi:predicted anti-sigma-YlaC factor YlaD